MAYLNSTGAFLNIKMPFCLKFITSFQRNDAWIKHWFVFFINVVSFVASCNVQRQFATKLQ